ncbi:recombinase family protein [Peribacillus loiseleuriae]|uniref:recombinase family protein n=1 Tax=Peribacillus loiseleuriae TaxID=1679170 RepID=UPI003D02E0FB
MKTAIYIRVSTEEQAQEGYSISAQRQRLKAYCIAQDWNVVGFYVDEGISAKDMNRPQLQKLIKEVEAGDIDCVLVYRLDRLTRSVLDLYKLLQLFEKHGCKFKSATEVYDTTTAMGRLFITLVAALAQWERENTAERVRFGMAEKARQGKWTSSIPPFGYNRDGDNLTINDQESEVVNRIFNYYLDGYGMGKIAILLNQNGSSTKSGHDWHTNTIKYILTNPIYKGTMRWNYSKNKEQYFEVANAAPALIDQKTFDEVEKIINLRTNKHPRAATSEFIFSGVAKCARCGSPLAGKYGYSKRGEIIHRPRAYYCTSQKRGLCDLPNISERFIEHHFMNAVKMWDIKEPELSIQPAEDKFAVKRTVIQNDLSEIEKRRKKWQYAWASEIISDEDFSQRMTEEQEKEKNLKEQLKHIPDKDQEEIPKHELAAILADLRLNWDYLSALEKKNFLGMFVKSIKVDKKDGPRGKLENVKITELNFY